MSLHEEGPRGKGAISEVHCDGQHEVTSDERQLTVFDALAEARQLRDDGQRRALHTTHHGWREAAERVIRELAASGRAFTADDVTQRVGHAVASSPNAVGSLISVAAKRGTIRKCGYVPSRRPSRHGGYVFQWIGTGDQPRDSA